MSEDALIKNKKLISFYGEYLFSYEGNGILTIIDGEGQKKIDCHFEAGQLTNGEILLFCNGLPPGLSYFTYYGIRVSLFEGTTIEGHSIKAIQLDSDLGRIAYLPENCDNALLCTNAAFRIDELTVILSNMERKEIRFGLTNFEIEVPTFQSDIFSDTILSLSLKGVNIKIIALQNFFKVFLQTKTLKIINVMSEAVFPLSKYNDISQITQIMDNLSILISIARGRKVQWIYYTIYDLNNSPISRTHFAYITKPYAALSIIDHNHENLEEIKEFLEVSYSNYPPSIINFNKWVVEEYLAAKLEGDYLEARAKRIVITLEILKALNKKMPELSDSYFREFITKLCKKLNVGISESEINLFYESRNSLIHEGEFYCKTATDEKKKKIPPLPTPVDEYFFLINFVDKIFIKLLGYNGIYLDWSKPKNKPFPQRKQI